MIQGMNGPSDDGLCVVDASVGVKWVIVEEDTPHADHLFEEYERLAVPDRFFSEVANVLWKRTRRADPSERITETVARDGLSEILALGLRVTSSAELVSDSLEIALEIGHPTYDCDYLALALREGATLVTADRKFYLAVAAHPKYGAFIRWVNPEESI